MLITGKVFAVKLFRISLAPAWEFDSGSGTEGGSTGTNPDGRTHKNPLAFDKEPCWLQLINTIPAHETWL